AGVGGQGSQVAALPGRAEAAVRFRRGPSAHPGRTPVGCPRGAGLLVRERGLTRSRPHPSRAGLTRRAVHITYMVRNVKSDLPITYPDRASAREWTRPCPRG